MRPVDTLNIPVYPLDALPHFQNPFRQRRFAHAFACSNILIDPRDDFAPSRSLPDFERPLIPTETPPHGEIKIARIVSDFGEVDGAIVKQITEYCPEKLRLRILAGSQRGKFVGRIFTFEQFFYVVVNRSRRKTIFFRGEIEHMDFLAHFLINPAFGFLPECPVVYQGLQPFGHGIVLMPGIAGQRIAHGTNHVCKNIQPHHIRGTKSGAFGATDQRTGQSIHQIEPQTKFSGVMHGSEHGKYTRPIGDKVWGILCANHSLAQVSDQECFEVVKHRAIAFFTGNQLYQVHIARRVEKMDTAKTVAQVFGKRLRQLIDGEPRCIAGKNCMLAEIRRYFFVQLRFPVHALGDGFNHDIAIS